MVGVILLLVAAAAFGIYSFFFAARSLPFQSIKIARVSGTHNARIGAMSPDGNYLAYVVNNDAGESLWLRHLASESNMQIIPPQRVQYHALRFSPDGSHIYYSHTQLASGPASREYDLFRIPVLGGTPQVVVKDTTAIQVSLPMGSASFSCAPTIPTPASTTSSSQMPMAAMKRAFSPVPSPMPWWIQRGRQMAR